ncbi:MAG TPA: MFS transporter [Micromonosporaceae bacterium]|jgi:MFS family permease|nr:MFS transporter [Micromonosporaceae bacterium]
MDHTGTTTPKSLLTPKFLTVVSASLAYFLAVGILVPAVPRYVAGPLGGGDAAVGMVVGAFSVSALALRPWTGRLADRRGRAPLMTAGAGVVALSIAGYAIADTVLMLLGLRLLTGIGEALFWVGAMAAVGDLAPEERRGEAMSWASLALYVGLALGPAAGEALVTHRGYLTTWLVASAVAGSALLLAARVGETRESVAAAVGQPRARLLHPAAVVPAALLLSVVLGMAGVLTFAPLYARDLGLGNSGPLLFGFAGTIVAIRSFGARLPDQLGPSRATVSALAGVTVGLAIIGLWRTAPGLVVGTLVLAVGIALATPSIMALAWQSAPAAERGAATGTVGMAIDLGLGFGPAALGLVASLTSRPGAYLAATLVAAGGLVLALVSSRNRPATPRH